MSSPSITYLSSGTDAAGMALFDPLAARTALGGRGEVGQDEVEAAALAGELLYWYTAADGTHALRVYVDEPVPAEVRAKAENGATGLLLHVPSGRLVFAGVELLGDLDDDPARWPGDEPGLDLAAGDYALDAFEVSWADADDQAYAAALHAQVGRRAAWLTEALGVATGVLVMVTVASAIPALILLFARPARFLALFPAAALGYGTAWALAIGAWRMPLVARVQAARERLDRAWPDAVVVLRRLADDEPRPARGGCFGVGYAGDARVAGPPSAT